MINTSDPTNSLAALLYNKAQAEIINQLCEPLFTNFNITMFVYSHFFKNGTYLDLSTNTNWQQHYIENFAAHQFVIDYVQKIYFDHIEYVLWNNDIRLPRDKTLTRFIADSCAFDIWHGFSIYKHHENSLEAWHFGTTKENYNIVNFYINHLDVLHHFISYFQDKAASIIDTKDVGKLIVFEGQPLFSSTQDALSSENPINEYMGQTKINRYTFNTSRGVVYVSRREAESIMHLSASKTIKEAARLMNLSPRTVEDYISNAKRKLGCGTRSQLIEFFLNHHDKFQKAYFGNIGSKI